MKLNKQKAFKVFRKEARKWIKFFGIMDWEVYFVQKDLEEDMAQCLCNTEGRTATIVLGKTDVYNSLEEIKKSAFHEVCELLLHDYGEVFCLGKMKNATRASLAEQVAHIIIRRLENSVFKQSLRKQK